MNVQLGLMLWAAFALCAAIAIVASRRKLGAARAAGWSIGVGIVVLLFEEPLLLLWWAMVGPGADPDGIAGLVSEPSRAHVIESAVLATAFLVGMGAVALVGLRRDPRRAHRILCAGWVIVFATVLVTTIFVYSRGLPLPTPGGRADGAGFGWEQLAAGLVAWLLGLVSAWPAREPTTIRAFADATAPPEALSRMLVDPALLPLWFRGAAGVLVSADWPAPGSTMTWRIGTRGEFAAESLVDELPHRLEMRVRTPSGMSTITHRFSALDASTTRYDKTVEIQFEGASRILAPVLSAVLRREVPAEVRRMARAAEEVMADA